MYSTRQTDESGRVQDILNIIVKLVEAMIYEQHAYGVLLDLYTSTKIRKQQPRFKSNYNKGC